MLDQAKLVAAAVTRPELEARCAALGILALSTDSDRDLTEWIEEEEREIAYRNSDSYAERCEAAANEAYYGGDSPGLYGPDDPGLGGRR